MAVTLTMVMKMIVGSKRRRTGTSNTEATWLKGSSGSDRSNTEPCVGCEVITAVIMKGSVL
jgi:hypothetical protein